MQRAELIWKAGAVLTAGGIATGAFGAHGLKAKAGITLDKIDSWKSASHYAMLNGLGLLLISRHPRFATHWAPLAIAGGATVFSTSIFALVLDRDRFKFLGPITPMGGMAMIIGYLALAF
ncbi:hypothetical protein BDV98DRAFT_559729 [Pterulicium gracile]|uniref:DUF423-domain-containing protein n=1 Tax=Pterulicium gracile TaxID=1884261 RepID=A0A5C3R626_9AGAR|nr:hypothetical protein BDV98DRAFT_559729 [Pterula gracilis]